jgi:NADH-quinone oxidoreductase subunit H
MALAQYLQHSLGWSQPWAWAVGNGVLIAIGEFILLVSVAFFILADRKVWAAVGMRRGPNVVGAFGLLQTFADAFKFLLKEAIVPSGANKVVFILAPLVTATLAFAGWAVVPIAPGWVAANINVGILYLFAISSLGVYGIIMAGWASNSKYPFLSALRAAAQMVSYEVSIGFVIITVLIAAGSLNLSAIVNAQQHRWFVFSILFPMLPIFFVSALAETNRPPFDLVEAESELVAGFFVEYSATPFLLFFLGEYVSVVLMCAMCTILFFGGWLPPLFWPLSAIPFVAQALSAVPAVIWFLLKLFFFFFLFAMVKAIVPRFRYDQLMRLGWKVFLPLSLLWVVITAGWVMMFRGV